MREGYRMTELGELPVEWDTVKLGDRAYIKARIGWKGLKAEEYTTEGPLLIAGKHIKGTKIMWNEADHLSYDRYNESPEIQLKNGDIIMSKDGTIGRVGFVDVLPQDSTINGTMMLIRLDESFYSKYIFYYFQGRQFQRLIADKVSGSSVPHIFQRDMVNLTVNVPDKKEQQKISDILSTVDGQIENTESLIEKTKELKKGLMQKLLTKGIEHTEFKETEVGVIPKEWEVRTLSMVCDRIIVGLATSVTKYYREEGTPIIRNLNIKKGYFDGDDMLYLDNEFAEQQKTKAVKANDVITVHTGSNLGLSCLVPLEYENSQTFTTLITTTNKDMLSPQYLTQHLNSVLGISEIDRLQVGGGKSNLNVKDFQDYLIAIPPIEEQKKISSILFQIDDTVKLYEEKKEKLQQLKQGLMQQLLTGKIRVKA